MLINGSSQVFHLFLTFDASLFLEAAGRSESAHRVDLAKMFRTSQVRRVRLARFSNYSSKLSKIIAIMCSKEAGRPDLLIDIFHRPLYIGWPDGCDPLFSLNPVPMSDWKKCSRGESLNEPVSET